MVSPPPSPGSCYPPDRHAVGAASAREIARAALISVSTAAIVL
jgi:hypothetical protein